MKIKKTAGQKKDVVFAATSFKTKFDDRGRRLMICINSTPG